MLRDIHSAGGSSPDRAISSVVGAVLMTVRPTTLANTIVVGLSTDLTTSIASDITSGDLDTSGADEILAIGVDTDCDFEETTDADDGSGVHTNDDDSDSTVTLEPGTDSRRATGSTAGTGADNPDSAGEYDVSVRINDAEWTDGTLAIEG